MEAAMSTASNAIKTGLFTLFVPLVVGVWIPQRMLSDGRIGTPVQIGWRVLGGLLFVLGVVSYFWSASLFVRAQGTPAPIFPTKRTVVAGRIESIAIPCTCLCSPWFSGRQSSIATCELRSMEYF
jgi:hypothetical protein